MAKKKAWGGRFEGGIDDGLGDWLDKDIGGWKEFDSDFDNRFGDRLGDRFGRGN